MQTQHLISAEEFCFHHQVEYSFINSLHQFGLIEIKTIEENRFIDPEKLTELEKFIRLHYDLDINLEGIEAITSLLQKVKSLQYEINTLKSRLSLYESIE
ncbi:MAG: chaperone modulator CbpM [Ginsengibacter sp.]